MRGEQSKSKKKKNKRMECVKGREREKFREVGADRAGRKLQRKTHGVTEGRFRVIDGPLSKVVNILKIGSIKSVGCSSTSLLAGRVQPQAFDKARPPCLLIYTYIH